MPNDRLTLVEFPLKNLESFNVVIGLRIDLEAGCHNKPLLLKKNFHIKMLAKKILLIQF